MPKVSATSLPISGLFAIVKPSGPTSMAILDRLKPLFARSRLLVSPEELETESKKSKGKRKKGRMSRSTDKPKLGQGGTLDPLADGVLVLGVNRGTKVLGQFLECSKEYRATALLGCETDSYDSKGARVRVAPYSHLTRDDVEKVLHRFRGEIQQMPPIFSALKMDGKPLYEYARTGQPLPRPIEARKCTIHELVLESWTPAATSPDDLTGHHFRWPENEIDEEQRETRNRVAELVLKAETEAHPNEDQSAVTDALKQDTPPLPTAPSPDPPTAPVFVLRMSVSSGTYVRSIVHDIGLALGSAAHVVTLTRTRQGKYGLASASQPALTEASLAASDAEKPGLMDGNCVKWEVLERALEKLEAGDEHPEAAEGGWESWEQAIIQSWSED